jgi:hypothetical protein
MDLEEPDDSGDDFSFDGEEETRSRSRSRSMRSVGSHSPSTSSTASTSTSESTSLRGNRARETGEDLQTNGDGKRSSEVDTEEDPIDPITPHAATFAEHEIVHGELKLKGRKRQFREDLETMTMTMTTTTTTTKIWVSGERGISRTIGSIRG